MERLTVPDAVNHDGTKTSHIIDAREVQKVAMDFYWRLKKIEDILGDTYDLDRLRELVEADREARDRIREFAEDVAYQFGYYIQNKGSLALWHGGLSTLESAFSILGWDEPHPVPECECEADGCHKHATCGCPTKDGYKRLCGKHYAKAAL